MRGNLTSGSVVGKVIYFSIPYMLAYFLQLFYGMADLFIIGQFCGVASTTAVADGSQVMHMITVAIVGLAMGSTVAIGRAVGANDAKRAARCVGNTITIFLALSLVLMALLPFCASSIISIMSVPIEAVPAMSRYLMICFIGIPFITIYNIISAVYRGLGDSKSPLYFAILACAVNIVLDYIFIGAMHMDASGAACGTVFAQGISALVAFAAIMRRGGGASPTARDFKPDRDAACEMLKVGVPIAFQDWLLQISFIAITVIANMRGLNDAAAVGVVEKIIAVLFLVPLSMLSTTSALCAQNLGAGLEERAHETLRWTVMLSVAWGVAVCFVMQFASETFVGLFTSDALVASMGGEYMRGYIWDCILTGLHFNISGYFCACGKSWISFAHNITSVVLARIPLAYLASINFVDTLYPMGLATPIGSSLSAIICVVVYLRMKNKSKSRAAL